MGAVALPAPQARPNDEHLRVIVRACHVCGVRDTQPFTQHHDRRRMTRAERRLEAREARLRVLLRGTSALYAAVAASVRAKHAREAREQEERLRLWQAGAIACGPSGGVLAAGAR